MSALELALVGAPAKELRPFWEIQAESLCQRYGEFARPLLNDWKRVVRSVKANGIRKANQRLDKLRAQFKIGDFIISNTDDEALTDYAAIKAFTAKKKMAGWPERVGTADAAKVALDLCQRHGFEEAETLQKYLEVSAYIDSMLSRDWLSDLQHDCLMAEEEEQRSLEPAVVGIIKRVQNEKWWKGRIRRLQAQRIELISRELHQVVITRSAYCSPVGRREWQRRQAINMDMLEHTLMENDEGDQFTLADLSETSVANPAVRRTELMVRMAGFEEYSKSLGYEGWFLTITCPSKYHAAYKSGARNVKFNGASPREAQQYLCRLWAGFRSLAARITKTKPEAWEFFGFRVAEPHHDGTPHWHLALFINPDHAPAVIAALEKFAMKEDGNEPGAAEARFKALKIKTGINPATGKEYSATGYIAKYIAKNIDGEHVDKDLYGQDAKASARDITAWASRNGIRQFQQVGGPSVTLWRELRRLANMPEEAWLPGEEALKNFALQLDALAKDNAATAWKTYCEFYEGDKMSLQKALKTISETIRYLDDLGNEYSAELERPALNEYGETGIKITGVILEAGGKVIEKVSRFRKWVQVACSKEEAYAVRIMRKAEREARAVARAALGEAAKAAELNGALAPTWTGVNNCTGGLDPGRNTNQGQLPLPV